MMAEVCLAFVDEEQWIDRAIKAGKVPLLVLEEQILIAHPIRATAAVILRGRRRLVLHGRHVGL